MEGSSSRVLYLPEPPNSTPPIRRCSPTEEGLGASSTSHPPPPSHHRRSAHTVIFLSFHGTRSVPALSDPCPYLCKYLFIPTPPVGHSILYPPPPPDVLCLRASSVRTSWPRNLSGYTRVAGVNDGIDISTILMLLPPLPTTRYRTLYRRTGAGLYLNTRTTGAEL